MWSRKTLLWKCLTKTRAGHVRPFFNPFVNGFTDHWTFSSGHGFCSSLIKFPFVNVLDLLTNNHAISSMKIN